MTSSVETKLVCECGHKGRHMRFINEDPDSSDTYSLEGFKGGGEALGDVTQMTCHKCGRTGNVRHA